MKKVFLKRNKENFTIGIKFVLSFIFILFFFEINIIPKENHFNPQKIISRMTLREKIDLISGYKNFYIKGVKRLGIPPVKMADGPMGLNGNGKATAFPASICMAASWNPSLIKKAAASIAEEAKSKGVGILLAPGVNMYRLPHCGRNFEYFGEDPFLASESAVAYIKGVQSKRVIATVKHFVANNEDYDRHRLSSDIDERSLNEIYFPVFKAAVKRANVGAVMTSYNPVNGVHASESPFLINKTLKSEWSFKGFVMSDWISVYSTKAFYSGLDLEMPRPQFMNYKNILSIIRSDPGALKILNDKVARILTTCNKFGLYDLLAVIPVNWEKHKKVAGDIAREGFVLLKNEDKILPINKNNSLKIVVLGPNAFYTPHSGGGAAKIEPYEMVSFYEGIKRNAYKNYSVDYFPTEGLHCEYSEINRKEFYSTLDVVNRYDYVILCVGFNPGTEGEAFDRSFSLPKNQEKLIEEVFKRNQNIIITINGGGGIFMPWIDKIKALLYTWYPGQEGGNSLGEILFGKTNPSGKLPVGIERTENDNPAFKGYHEAGCVTGTKPFYTLYGKKHIKKHLNYEEGIFTGYRYYEKEKIKTLFPFGFGLSYSTFKISDMFIDKYTIKKNEKSVLTLNIENTGKYRGAETIQLYIHDVSSTLPRPYKELKGFKKVWLYPGEKRRIEFMITPDMLASYDTIKHDWNVEDGDFDILIGNSSDHIVLKKTIEYKNR